MLIQVNDRHPRQPRFASPALSTRVPRGVTGHAGGGVDPRLTVRLDTDPHADPLFSLTAQVGPAVSGADRFQTHPHGWGVSPGAAHA